MISRALAVALSTSLAVGLGIACAKNTGGDDETATTTGGPGAGGPGGGGGAAPAPEYEVVVCDGAPSATPGDDVCAVTAGDARTLVVGDVLVPGTVYEHGGVLIGANGSIECVGCECAAAAAGATQVVCPDAVVSAGLINAHDHVGWMNGAPWVAADEGVDPALRWEHRNDWRRGKRGNPEINVAGGSASQDQKTFGELRFVLSGTTAIFGSGDLGGLLRDLDATGSGDNGLGRTGAEFDTFPLGDTSGTQLESGCSGYTVTDPAPSSMDCYAPHVAEGIDDVSRNEFLCLSGDGTGSKQVLDDRSAIIHGIGLEVAEINAMATGSMRLIWSPRSNLSLYGDTARVTVYDELGVPIALGTDWLPSGSMNMLREIACAASFNDEHLGGYFSDHKLWKMATIGGARALAFDDVLGMLAVGFAGDVAVFRKNGHQHYGAVVRAAVEDVALVLRGGKVLSGNAAVVTALESGCDALDVCGVAKQVCVSRDSGLSLADLEALNMPYPLFFCGTPDDEPSCLPARTLTADAVDGSGLYSGTSSASDTDGDGIEDAADNCPNVFNPVRPVDNGAQGNADGDTVGDECDPCPFDADSTACVGSGTDDKDGDGVLDTSDNCPSASNADQADDDGDAKGNACDPCPNVPNPGAQSCPGTNVSIYAIQDATNPSHPTEGTRVRIACLVSAVASNGLWCQEAAGGPYSGIAIYVGAAPSYLNATKGVQIGDNVTIDGDYAEFFGASQLESPELTYVGQGAVPTPLTIVASSLVTGAASAEMYEGVLVRVMSVTVTNSNPDAPSDYDETAVTAGLRIDDQIIDGGGMGGSLDNNYTVGTPFSQIVGIHHFSFSNFKLLPRTLADIVP